MRLREFVSSGKVSTASLEKKIATVSKLFNKKGVYLGRYGGPKRVMENVDNPKERVVIFGYGKTEKAIGLSAGGINGDSGDISRIYIWNNFLGPQEPDFCIILPLDLDIKYCFNKVIELIKSPEVGEFPISLKEGKVLSEMAKRVDAAAFVNMAAHYIADERPHWNIAKLSMNDLKEIAQYNDVQLPLEIRRNYSPPRTSYYDLSVVLGSGEQAMKPEDRERMERDRADQDAAAAAAGAEMDHNFTPSQEEDPEVRGKLQSLGKAMDVLDSLAKKGRLIVQGRRENGRLFKISGGNVEGAINALKNLLDKQLELGLDDGDDGDMHEQMDELKAYVRGVVSGTSQTAHSVILTGAPGVGKTFTVMKEIVENNGLDEGSDYVVIQGGTTTTKLFERLFVSHDKIIIFDDCDSMWKDMEAVNILKAALQTGAGVRAITRDKAGTIDTAKMSFEDREQALNEIRSFYDDPHSWAIRKLQRRFPDVAELISSIDDPSENPYDKEDKDQRNDHTAYKSYYAKEVQKPLETGSIKLPNKIHFEGRIIFISNLDEEDLDDAVKSRATVYNVRVTNMQVVDFVGQIMDKFPHDYVDQRQREELYDFISELYTTGMATSPFSIRAFQVCMDLYAMGGNWKKRIARRLKG